MVSRCTQLRSSLFFCLFVLLAGQNLRAETELLLGVYDLDYEPYQVIKNGEPVGPDIDIVREVFSRLDDYSLRLRLLPANRAHVFLMKGEIDLLPLFRTAKREKYALFTDTALHYSVYRVAVNKESELRFREYADLSGLDIGIVRNIGLGAKIERQLKAGVLTLQPVDQWVGLVNGLVDHRFDAIVGNETVVQYIADRIGAGQEIKFLDKPFMARRGLMLALSRNVKVEDPQALISAVSRILEDLCREGFVAEVVTRHRMKDPQNFCAV